CAKPQKNSKSADLRLLSKPRTKVVPMTGILQNYLPLVVFIGVAGVIGLVLLIAPFLVAFQQPDPEKLSAYECGFNAFDDARMKFDVRFYLVAILFIIFDLEVAFLFPWAVAFGKLGATGFWSMVVFLAVLTVGFAYEWKKAARAGDGAGHIRRARRSRRRQGASWIPPPAGRSAPTTRISSRSTTNSPTRASSSPQPMISSPGRAPAR